MRTFLCFLSAALFLAGCSQSRPGGSGEGRAGQAASVPCEASSFPRPAWANANGANPKAGLAEAELWDAAVGISDRREGRSEPDYDLARYKALSALGQTLGVNVVSRVNLVTKKSGGEVETGFRESVGVESEMDLVDVESRGVWADPETCRAFARVAIPKTQAEELALLQIAAGKNREAGDAELSLKRRLGSAEESLALVAKVRFEHLPKKPSRRFYEEKFAERRDELLRLTEARSTLFVLLIEPGKNPADFAPPVRTVLEKVRAGFDSESSGVILDESCSAPENCLRAARGERSLLLVVAQAAATVKEAEAGGYLGHLKISVRKYEVATGKQRPDPPRFLNGSTFGLSRDEIDWNTAAQNLR